MHQSLGKGSSVSPEAVEYCRQHEISVIAGACPMMFGPGADVGHTRMRWILKLTGGLPAVRSLSRDPGAPRTDSRCRRAD